MININATDEYRIIVPIRWERFNHGSLARRDSPEIDDRGYFIRRTSAWGAATTRGPMFGVLRGNTVKVRVMREDIDDTAPLFATSDQPTILEIKNTDAQIPADGELQVEGKARGTATIHVRLGSVTGPILADCDVRVHTRLRVKIQPWMVRIDTTTATGATPATDLDAMFQRCRAIWRPAGIDFTLGTAQNVNVQLASNTLNSFNVITGNWRNESAQLLALQAAGGPVEKAVHWFIIDRFAASATLSPVGLGISRQTANAGPPVIPHTGIVTSVRDTGGNLRDTEATARTLAHEIGHFFRLPHARGRDSTPNPPGPAKDTFARRQLMFPISNLSGGTSGLAVPRFDNVGYGDTIRGCLITMKELEHYANDGEVAVARNAIQNDTWF